MLLRRFFNNFSCGYFFEKRTIDKWLKIDVELSTFKKFSVTMGNIIVYEA